TRCYRDWSSDVCSSDLGAQSAAAQDGQLAVRESARGHRIPACGNETLHVGALARDIRYRDGVGVRADNVEALQVRAQGQRAGGQIGRASCRERGWISGG